jgi:hypothetical protein
MRKSAGWSSVESVIDPFLATPVQYQEVIFVTFGHTDLVS